MKVIVCVKQAINESELKADSSGKPELQNSPTKISDFDRNAVEEAIRIKESKDASVVILSLGTDESKKSVKEALAMGADRGLVIQRGDAELDTLETSYYLSRVVQKEAADLVLCSEGSSDTYSGQVGPMLAEWAGFPFVGYARKVEIMEGGVRCEQVYEDRIEVCQTKFPTVISVVSEINQPRFASLIQIIQASKKQIEDIPLENLKDDQVFKSRVQVIDVNVQPVNRRGVIFEGAVDDVARGLVETLRKEKLIPP